MNDIFYIPTHTHNRLFSAAVCSTVYLYYLYSDNIPLQHKCYGGSEEDYFDNVHRPLYLFGRDIMFPVFLFPLLFLHDLPRGIILLLLCMHILLHHVGLSSCVSHVIILYLCVYAVRDQVDVCSGITILNVPAGSTNPSPTNCRLFLSKYASSVWTAA